MYWLYLLSLLKVTKKKPLEYLPDASAKTLPSKKRDFEFVRNVRFRGVCNRSCITVTRSKSKAGQEKIRAAQHKIVREAWVTATNVGKKETTRRPSSRPSPIITRVRSGKPKHEVKEIRRRGRTTKVGLVGRLKSVDSSRSD